MVDTSSSPPQTPFGLDVVFEQSSEATSSRGEAPSSAAASTFPDFLATELTSCIWLFVVLKRTPLARGTRALHAPSIGDGFCRQPWPECVAGSGGPAGCHLAHVAAGAPRAVSGEDGQSGSRPATTPGGQAGMRTAAPWPRCGVRALRCRGGRSDSPAR